MIKLNVIFLVLSVASAQDCPIEQFVTANNLFAHSIYQEVAKTDSNFIVSPFSAETILALTQAGARGETAEEMRKALHLPNKETVESALKTLLPIVTCTENFTLHTANKMYLKHGFTIKPEFKNAAQVFGADIETIDFTRSDEAAKAMNSWVGKQTNEKIKNLIDSSSLDIITSAVLINALYLKANWSTPFQPPSTSKSDFHTPQGVVQVDTLHHFGENFQYYESPHLGAQFLELPFRGGEASMVIVLPNERFGISNLETQLDKVFQQELEIHLVNVALPKFKIETGVELTNVLKNLGVTKIFQPGEVDLSGIAGVKGDLVVDEVKQKSFVEVSEMGVEAASATSVVIPVLLSASLSIPKKFNADHPFIFYIRLKDLVLFAGRVVDPSR